MSILGTILGGLAIGGGLSAGKQAIIDPVINGISNLISGGNWRQSGEQVAQNEFNAKEAVKAHERSIEARDTAIDSQVAQLEKNGINTAMYFGGGGSGAATPTSSSASSSGLGGGVNTASYNPAGLLNAAANVANVMNNDKVKGNNMNAAGVTSIVLDIAKLIGK